LLERDKARTVGVHTSFKRRKTMRRSVGLTLTMAALLLVAGAGCGRMREGKTAGPVTVPLATQSNSGESGTATLTEEGGKTRVVVTVNGAPAGVSQPLHIHRGTCAQLNPQPAYGLTTLINGRSETTVDVPLATLRNGEFAINGHKSAQEASTYVFCGSIPRA
jgi:Cu/Zn superoxide dismutase